MESSTVSHCIVNLLTDTNTFTQLIFPPADHLQLTKKDQYASIKICVLTSPDQSMKIEGIDFRLWDNSHIYINIMSGLTEVIDGQVVRAGVSVT